MAKTVKFNLICDGQPIRTLTDLQEHFSIEDVLNHYDNGMLARWLETRGYTAHLAAVNAVNAQDDLEKAKLLCEIFEVEDKDMAKKVENREYEAKLAQQKETVNNLKQSRRGGIDEYHQKYEDLIQKIIDNKTDIPVIKECIEDIAANYRQLLELDYWRLFEIMRFLAPLAVFVALTNDTFREKFLMPEKDIYNFTLQPAINVKDFITYFAPNDAFTGNNMPMKAVALGRLRSQIRKAIDINYYMTFIRGHIHTEINNLTGAIKNNTLPLQHRVNTQLGKGSDYWLPIQAAHGKKLLVITMSEDSRLKLGQKVSKHGEINDIYPLVDSFEFNGSSASTIFYIEA